LGTKGTRGGRGRARRRGRISGSGRRRERGRSIGRGEVGNELGEQSEIGLITGGPRS